MKALLVPLLLALVGTAGGVGAGIMLVRPPAPPEDPAAHPPGDAVAAQPCGPAAAADPAHAGDHPVSGFEYVRLDNQFVVPLMSGDAVGALIVMSLSVEVAAGATDRVYLVEPRLRDIFLQVLFDQANTGRFDGVFTATANLRDLRGALFQAIDEALPGLITDVLIVDIVRQDV